MTTETVNRQEAIEVPLRIKGIISFGAIVWFSIMEATALALAAEAAEKLALSKGATALLVSGAGIALLPVLVFLLKRAWRIALVVDRDGVTVVNYWRTHYLRWSQVDEVFVRWCFVELIPERVLAFKLKSGGWSVPALATLWPGKRATQEKGLIRKYCEPKGIPLNVPERWANAWF